MKSLLKVCRSKFYFNFNKRFLFNNAFEKPKFHTIHNMQIENEDNPRVLIVGAGISGLSAASYLVQKGIENVKVIEASTRVGGRIHSVQFGDTICELGAKWINEPDSNDSVFELVSIDKDLKNHPQNFQKICLTNNGSCVDNHLSYSVALAFNNILSQEIISSGDFENISRVYLQKEINKILQENFENADEIIYKMFLSHNDILSGYFGSDLFCVHTNSLKKIAKSFKSPVFIKSGLNQISKQLIKNVGKERIILGHPIGTIHWSNSSLPEIPIVYCLNGSRFAADHIIFTLPLGAMKMFHHIFFNPLLPKTKSQAIFSLGFGSPIKIYLKYEENIHDWLPGAINLVWTTTESRNTREWSTHITEISPVPDSQQVLEMKVNGQVSESVERLKDDVICEEATNVLRRFLGNDSIPFPSEILRSNWSSDAKYFGGLPFLSLLSKEDHITELGRPIYSTKNSEFPILLFAGDATISEGFGTLDGAIKSGIREAMRIVKLYDKTE